MVRQTNEHVKINWNVAQRSDHEERLYLKVYTRLRDMITATDCQHGPPSVCQTVNMDYLKDVQFFYSDGCIVKDVSQKEHSEIIIKFIRQDRGV